MSKKQYRISRNAIRDLSNIWSYTCNKWSKAQADRYYKLLIDEIGFIANHHPVGKAIGDTRKNYRQVKVKSHLIFYRTTQEDIIEIVRILHQRMDLKNRL